MFLDRDGTVIEEVNYLSRLEDVRPMAGVGESLRRLRGAGFAVVLVTNQSGVARGYFDEAFVRSTHRLLEDLLSFSFDAVYYCPHGPDDDCDCRKPRPGMIQRAVVDLGLDVSRSYVVGDKPADVELAERAGMKGVLVLTGYGAESSGMVDAVHLASDINEACDWILAQPGSRRSP